MKTQSVFSSNAVKRISLWVMILSLLFVLLSSFIIPAQAAGEGWVEARATVPSEFKENIIVSFIRLEDGEEYATRLMQVNGYISYFTLPAGNYTFDGAYLENLDFRYNVSLSNGVENFVLTDDDNSPAVLLTFNTTYNEAYENGAKPTDPPEQTETVSTESVSGSNVLTPTEAGSNKKPTATKPGANTFKPGDNQPTETTEATESAGSISESSQETTPSVSESKSGTQYQTQEPTVLDQNDSQVETSPDDVEPTAKELSTVQKLLYGILSTGIFIGILFGVVFLFRRHMENS